MSKTEKATAAWATGLAACLCNLMVVLLPAGIILGVVALALGVAGARMRRVGGTSGVVLAGISFLIALVWAATVASVFLFDPTLL